MSRIISGTSTGSVIAVSFALGLVACGSGSDNSPVTPQFNGTLNVDGLMGTSVDSSVMALPVGSFESSLFESMSDSATYLVTVRNYWGVENYPQGFPDNAHLSLFGGAVHNASVSFWEIGEPPSRGIEDMAEAGLIDILLSDEVAPAIEQGTASSFVEVRQFTDPQVDGEPGELSFEITLTRSHPLISMTSMLGPSPDWFVGVSGLSLLDDGGTAGIQANDEMLAPWFDHLLVGSPLHDGGSKSDITPVMGGPDIIPPDPIGFVAYNDAAGVYLPTILPLQTRECM